MSDLLLRNGRIWTGVSNTPWADAALVRNGRFAFVGRESELDVAPGVEVLDVLGRLVIPGLIDGHAHLLSTGMAMQAVDLKGVASLGEAVYRVGERAKVTPRHEWIWGAGWDQNLWRGSGFPDRKDLDLVSTSHPIVLAHTSGHCIWVNSVALRISGITPSTASPEGGKIDSDPDGEPSGILRDSAAQLVYDVVPKPSHDQRLAALRTAVTWAHSLGVTGIHAMDVGHGELAAARELHAAGELRLRLRVFLSGRSLEDWLDEGLRTGDGDDVLKIGGVKFFADGALGSLTAWMLAPYEGGSDVGLPLQTPAELEARVRICLAHGLAPAIHAIGDRANREVLAILERARAVSPELPRRIEHAQLLSAADVGRLGQLRTTASVQPIHATQDMAKVDRCWGERGRGAYAFASLLAGGANLAFGSDTPVETMSPLAGIHAAVTRRTAKGDPPGGWYPDERISLEEAITAYTSGCARATCEDELVGRIAPGQYADFVVLSSDIFELDDPMRILEADADVTVVRGEVVHQRDHEQTKGPR